MAKSSPDIQRLLASVDNAPLDAPEQFLGRIVTLTGYLVSGYLDEAPDPNRRAWPFEDPPLCITNDLRRNAPSPQWRFVLDSKENLLEKLLSSLMFRITGIGGPILDHANGLVRARLVAGSKVYPYRLEDPTDVIALSRESYVRIL